MARISLQFHADPRELVIELLPRWWEDVPCQVAVEESPSSDIRISKSATEALARLKSDGVVPYRIFASLDPFVATGESPIEFMRANEGFLVVEPGRFRDQELRESVLGSLASRPDSVKAWRGVVRKAKRDLLTGAVLINARGDRFDDARHRFTPGALTLAARGVVMLAIAGEVSYELGHGQAS